MSPWWWLLWVVLVALAWGFCVGFARAAGYDVGLWFIRRRARRVTYRVAWGLGRREDFSTRQDAEARADELYADLTEWYPMLSGTRDAVLPRVFMVSETPCTETERP